MSETSAVSICSQALLLCGDKPIDSFDIDTNRTRLVANLYDQKRKKVLRAHPWNFATKRVILSPEVTKPEFDWRYQTLLPPDCLRVICVGLKDQLDDWEVSGRYVMTNTNVVRLKYIYDNNVESSWDALSVDILTQVMVIALTYALTKSTSKEELENALIRDMLKSARAVDGQENPAETLGDFPLLNSRRG